MITISDRARTLACLAALVLAAALSGCSSLRQPEIVLWEPDPLEITPVLAEHETTNPREVRASIRVLIARPMQVSVEWKQHGWHGWTAHGTVDATAADGYWKATIPGAIDEPQHGIHLTRYRWVITDPYRAVVAQKPPGEVPVGKGLPSGANYSGPLVLKQSRWHEFIWMATPLPVVSMNVRPMTDTPAQPGFVDVTFETFASPSAGFEGSYIRVEDAAHQIQWFTHGGAGIDIPVIGTLPKGAQFRCVAFARKIDDPDGIDYWIASEPLLIQTPK